jgi:hypothetical protein
MIESAPRASSTTLFVMSVWGVFLSIVLLGAAATIALHGGHHLSTLYVTAVIAAGSVSIASTAGAYAFVGHSVA